MAKSKDTLLAHKRREERARHAAVVRNIRENPIRAQIVYGATGQTLGTVTPQDDGTWTGVRYGPGYPNNRIDDVTEDAAAAYVADGHPLGGPPDPWPPFADELWADEMSEDELGPDEP